MGPVRRELNELSQVSLVGAFALDEVGDCPAQWRDPASGAVAAPHLPSFDEPGLSLVFKRLFPPYCEVQFLFEEHLGARLLSTFEAHAAPTAHLSALHPGWGERDPTTSSTLLDPEIASRYTAALPLPLMRRALAPLLATPFADDAALLGALRVTALAL